MSRTQHDQEPQRFRFRIHGHLGASTLLAFPEMEAETDGADTLLTGALPDRAALFGAIAQIERLGLDLVELTRLPASRAGTEEGVDESVEPSERGGDVS